MQLEDYFDFLRPDDIRIKGHRIGIETVLFEYLHRNRCPEEIQQQYSTLSMEEVYATILYYLHDPVTVGKYVADWLEWSHQAHKAAHENPSYAAQRLRNLRKEIESYPPEEQEAARQRIRERERLKHASTDAPAEAA